jgi:pSer/pThr/pTyr-binding forkhead associated (FHA) protein
MGKLVHVLPDGTTREIRLERGRITIGRRPDNDLCLPQPAVSGAHAAVMTILADSFLEDLGSTNGTLVNGVPIAKHFLRDRDEIDIGRETLVYLADNAEHLDVQPRADRADVTAARASPDLATMVIRRPFSEGKERERRRSDLARFDGTSDPAKEPIADASTGVAPVSKLETPIDPIAEQPAPAFTAPPRGPAIKVLTGVNAGRVLALDKSETLIGRAGVQIVALRRVGDEIRIVPIEGARLPNINGHPVASEGQRVAVGDIVEISGARLELLRSPDAGD